MAAFPLTHESTGFDSHGYKVDFEDPSIMTEMEGGYMTSRPRHTRAPRRTFSLVWRSMVHADYQTLRTFYDARRGGSETFTWTDPETTTVYTVRFKGGLSASYFGLGATKLWDLSLQLEQV
jgi:phage-related protein